MADYFEEMGLGPFEGFESMEDTEVSNPFIYYADLLRDFGIYSLLSEELRRPPPVSRDFYNNLKKETVEAKESKCTICLTEPEIGEVVIVLPCEHKYHTDCISPWLEQTSTCPVCRLDMPTDDQAYEIYRKEKLLAKKREEEYQSHQATSMFA